MTARSARAGAARRRADQDLRRQDRAARRRPDSPQRRDGRRHRRLRARARPRCCAASTHLELPTAGIVDVDGQTDRPRRGRRRLEGASERELARQRRGIGFVFQRFNLFPAPHARWTTWRSGCARCAGFAEARARASAPPSICARCFSATTSTSGRTSCPAASSSASRSRARSRWSRRSSCSTSRPRRSTRSSCARCSTRSALLASTGMTSVIVTHEMSFAQPGREPRDLSWTRARSSSRARPAEVVRRAARSTHAPFPRAFHDFATRRQSNEPTPGPLDLLIRGAPRSPPIPRCR